MQSFRQTIFYVDITTRPEHSLEQTLAMASELNQQRQQAGFNQQALDEAAKIGFANGVFEDTEDEGLEVVEEFYPQEVSNIESAQLAVGLLADKLQVK